MYTWVFFFSYLSTFSACLSSSGAILKCLKIERCLSLHHSLPPLLPFPSLGEQSDGCVCFSGYVMLKRWEEQEWGVFLHGPCFVQQAFCSPGSAPVKARLLLFIRLFGREKIGQIIYSCQSFCQQTKARSLRWLLANISNLILFCFSSPAVPCTSRAPAVRPRGSHLPPQACPGGVVQREQRGQLWRNFAFSSTQT